MYDMQGGVREERGERIENEIYFLFFLIKLSNVIYIF